MSLLDRVRACQRRDLSRCRRFVVDGEAVGWVPPDVADRLRGFPDTFVVDESTVRLNPRLTDFDSRSRAVDAVLRKMREEGFFPGWRDEPYPVATDFHAPPLLQLERAAVPSFGVRAYGIHVNGYVETNGEPQIWVARRSRSKPTAPGKLDHLVAGGQPMGIGLTENLIKEAAEEASLPEALARRARPAGLVSYLTQNEEGIRNDVLFAYDLAVPADFVPRNADGEIEEFFLWPLERVVRTLESGDEFKFNVALVIIDFLVRRGHLGPDHPDYVAIVHGLRLPA
jgi:hypothetical protein